MTINTEVFLNIRLPTFIRRPFDLSFSSQIPKVFFFIMSTSVTGHTPSNHYSTTHPHIHTLVQQKLRILQVKMNAGSSSSRNRCGRQPQGGRPYNIPVSLEPYSRIAGQRVTYPHEALSALFLQAEEARYRIERFKALFPSLAVACEACLAEEMTAASDAYRAGRGNQDPTFELQAIQEAINRMNTFLLWARRKMSPSGAGRPRASTHPGQRPPLLLARGPSTTTRVSESAMGTPRQRQQEQPRTGGTPPVYTKCDPAEQGIIQTGDPIPARPARPSRKVAFGKTTVIPDEPPNEPPAQGLEGPLTMQYFTSTSKPSPQESKRGKLKDFWKRARDLLGKKDPDPSA
ncbi:hypothetical protein L873DRAFT_1411119 [Choiromyces venosus 120613-1]|uniref:Uncharacterized protein n=1 Tax=Choiromyces venosus 120613-1 TaxID=1336337 RepID=A0A3N4JDQ9_9PEZI|nr:hypothetical protein L873DRAFT_1411119 [Choiromyces venosus 120613-1]